MFLVNRCAAWTLLVAALAAGSVVSPGAGHAQDSTMPATLQFRPMLKVGVVIKPGGAEVHEVKAGPATKMARKDNTKVRGIMERGDIITKVGEKAVKTLDDLKDGLAAEGQIVITVWDKRTRKEIEWIVNPE